MAHIALYRKWRPQTFDDLIGQEHISTTLINAILGNRLAHAYLFCGPRGTGKTTSARLLAKALNCEDQTAVNPCNLCQNCVEITSGSSLDVIEIDAASNRGIDDARNLREKVRFSATGGHYRVFIIDEFHMLTNEAFNALLKTLEEPPEKVIFVLATTEPHKILPTIISRCQRFDFQRIPFQSLTARLSHVAEKENIILSDKALEAIARKSAGGLRDALSLLDQISAVAGKEQIPNELVYQILGLIEEDSLFQLLKNLLSRDIMAVLAGIQHLMEKGSEVAILLHELLMMCRHVLVVKMNENEAEDSGVPSHLIPELKELATQGTTYDITRLMERLTSIYDRMGRSTQPEIWLEAELIQYCQSPAPISALESRVAALEAAFNNGQPLPPASPPVQEENHSLPPPPPAVSPPVGEKYEIWDRLLHHLKEIYKPGFALLKAGQLLRVDEKKKKLVINFVSQFHKDNLQKDRKKSAFLAQAVEKTMGEAYEVAIEVGVMADIQETAPPIAETQPIVVTDPDINMTPSPEPPDPKPETTELATISSPLEPIELESPALVDPEPPPMESITIPLTAEKRKMQDVADLFKGKVIAEAQDFAPVH